jgi:hypothetical protein
MKGYKVFNPDWTCRGFQFEVGKTFEEDVEPSCCDRGFHFCKELKDCFTYYKFDPNNKVAEVEAVGDIDTHSNDTKCSTNKLRVIREITWHEVIELVNLGKSCTGIRNSGNYNSGSFNSGNLNSGNWNSGGYNSGNWNSGGYNSGNWNSGDYNSGNWNSGDWNSGDYNSGDWNKTSYAVGCFNTERQKLKFFDKETDMTMKQWWDSEAMRLLNQIDLRPTDWILSDDMTDEEKAEHPEHETTGGYLKIRDNSDCCTEWWNGLSERNKNIIRSIPNFDSEKFYQITGIRA